VKRLFVLMSSILLFIGCSSFPKYSEKESLVVIPISIEKDNQNYQFYMHYELYYKDVFADDGVKENKMYYIPTSKKYFITKIPEGTYLIDTIFPIRVADKRKMKAYSANIPFDCKNGKINYITYQLDVSVKKGIDGIVEQRISYSPVDSVLLREVKNEIENDKNAKKWLSDNL
jgi:hypothetical protein